MALILRAGSFWVLILALGPWQSVCFAKTPGFTEAQAKAGRTDYRTQCASCHGPQLEGVHISPGLKGPRFDAMWRGKSADVLMFHLRRMPQAPVGAPGSLGDETYTNILAYILISNGLASGEEALPGDSKALGDLTIPQLEGEQVDLLAPTADAAASELLKNLAPVTDAMLRDPSPNDWLLTGRTYNAASFSPLAQINRENVAGLKPAWRTPLRYGMSMPMPLVHQGIMYLHTFPDTVIALDGTNGKILWRYEYKPKTGSSQKMGLGLSGDKVLVPTSDLHVLAVNAKTGELIWDHAITMETSAQGRGYQLRSAPLVVGDKVIQGVTASFVPKGGFLLAIDIESGKEVWRFNTIARPGEPYGDSWNGLPLEKRSGGSVWHQGSYDPELNLIYYGVAPTYDTGPLLHPVEDKSVNNKALYTNCTIALDPNTGKLVWHYQHMQNDLWDLDWAFERQIATVPVDGKPRKVVMNVGKMAILEALDAATGEYLFSLDSGVQNVITAIDPKTGAKTVDPEKMPDPGRPCDICPSAIGARAWPLISYSPKTNFVYVPIAEWCMRLGKEGVRLLTSGVGITWAEHPDARDGMMGRIQAIDVANQKLAWSQNEVAPLSTGMLATEGGLVFAGDLGPSLKAYDDATGEVLWRAKLDDNPSSSLITYSVGDKQYVAVVAGMNNLHVDGLKSLYSDFSTKTGAPREASPEGGAAIWTFALE
ncbi:MAG: PQQ-binding-like beta-propeller repeat protein [Candidatus Hydrogenedentota bacterium]